MDGHADVWATFRDAKALHAVVHAGVEPFKDVGITAVCGVESRGFLLGAAAAVQLGGGVLAGPWSRAPGMTSAHSPEGTGPWPGPDRPLRRQRLCPTLSRAGAG